MFRRSESYDTQGKKIDEWFYTYQNVEPASGQTSHPVASPLVTVSRKVTIEVKLQKTLSRKAAPPLPITKASFSVTCRDPEFSFEGTDIEELRAAAWAELDGVFAITWEPFIVIGVRPASHWSSKGDGFSLSWKRHERGTTRDGKLLHRELDGYRASSAMIKTWPDVWIDEQGNELACLPDTPELVEKLQQLGEHVRNFRKIFADSLRPNNIAQVLDGTALPAFLVTARTRKRATVS